jgi:hypothetical protein
MKLKMTFPFSILVLIFNSGCDHKIHSSKANTEYIKCQLDGANGKPIVYTFEFDSANKSLHSIDESFQITNATVTSGIISGKTAESIDSTNCNLIHYTRFSINRITGVITMSLIESTSKTNNSCSVVVSDPYADNAMLGKCELAKPIL